MFSRGTRLLQRTFARLFILISVIGFSLCLYCWPKNSKGGNTYLLIEHATLIDSTGSQAKDDMAVLIEGQRIKSIRAASLVQHVPDTVRFEAKGKFLIAGLWDMHVHTLSRNQPDRFLPLFIANGVTGVRDMGGDLSLAQIQQLKKEIADGTRLGPEIFAPGPILEGEHPFWTFSAVVKNEADAGRAISGLVREKADFVKVYNTLSRESYLAIASAAKQNRIPFVGHIPPSVTPAEASDLGQKSIEHLWGVTRFCSVAPEELGRMSADADNAEDPKIARDLYYKINQAILSSYSKRKAAALFARFASNGTWQDPTLVVLRSYASIHDSASRKDSRLAYIPDDLRKAWDSTGGAPDPRNDEIQQRLFEHDLEIVKAMHVAGVPLLAGTDTPNPYTYPGFSLHDELQLLVTAGLSSKEALETATRRAAQFLGVAQDFGSIEEGKIANLILLDANPLADIGNTTKIRAVILRGKLFDKAKLDELLALPSSQGRTQ
jgi:hypothetical protein